MSSEHGGFVDEHIEYSHVEKSKKKIKYRGELESFTRLNTSK